MIDKPRPSVSELELLLTDDGDASIEILPDGTLRQIEGAAPARKPLTFRNQLGGEYAE